MDANRIGKAISYLRKRAGYTQKDLADRIGISDKAVSKWERGLGLPDIGCLRKLSILLDTDTDSLLAGDVVHHDSGWQGILLMEENSCRLGAGTIIFDKPLVYFLLSYFLLVGIRDVLIICPEEDRRYIDETIGDGSGYGLRLRTVNGTLRDSVQLCGSTGNIMMVYGRCLLYGVDQTRFFQKAMMDRERFTMLVLPKRTRRPSPRIAIDQDRKVVNAESEEPLWTQYDFSDIPILFFPARFLPHMAEAEGVAAYIAQYASKQDVYVQVLDRGFVEIEVDDWVNVQEASTFLKIVQDKCGMNVYCIEEVAWRRGFISLEQLREHGERQKGTEYGEYILSLCERMQRAR